jgi:hypothetical protein
MAAAVRCIEAVPGHRTIGTVKTLRPLTTSMTPSVPNGVFYRCRRAIRAEKVES